MSVISVLCTVEDVIAKKSEYLKQHSYLYHPSLHSHVVVIFPEDLKEVYIETGGKMSSTIPQIKIKTPSETLIQCKHG